MIYITSDLHINHNKPFVYEARGFSSIEQHNEAILSNWNNIINDKDIIYILGDLILGDNTIGIEYLNRLKGKKFYIIGNHDTNTRIELFKNNNIECLGYSNILKYKKWTFYLSHYPTLCGNINNNKPIKEYMWNLCGHSHYTDPFFDIDKGSIFHCEMDTHNCTPWSIEEIINTIKQYGEEKNE